MKNRENYMKVLLEFKDKSVIKIITGVRRCGKSSLLELFRENLLKDGINEKNIIKINFESLEFSDILTYKELYNYVKNKIIDNKKKTYIILDEVQLVDKWEKAINSFLVDFDVDIYITGSNAYLLSSELSTLLSRKICRNKNVTVIF